MKSIAKWHDECNDKQNDKDLSEELRYNRELLSSIDEKVINDRMKDLTYSLIISSFIFVIVLKIIEEVSTCLLLYTICFFNI